MNMTTRNNRNGWLLAGLLVSMLGCSSASTCPKIEGKGDRALIVGVGSYAGGDNLRLHGPEQDRQTMRDVLVQDLGYREQEVCVIADEQATAEAIETAFKTWLIDGTQAGSRAFFYFSGHGVRLEGAGIQKYDERVDDALVAYDYQPASAGQSAQGVIRDDDLGHWFDQLEERQTVAVVDSCHSGTIYRSAGPVQLSGLARTPTLHRNPNLPRGLTRAIGTSADPLIAPRPGLIVWTASADFEVAYDAPIDNPHYGQFTHAWATALRKDSKATIGQIHASVRTAADAFCAELRGRKRDCTSLRPGLFAVDAVHQLRFRDVMGTGERWESLSHRNIENVVQNLGPTVKVEVTLADAYGAVSKEFKDGDSMQLLVNSKVSGYLTVFSIDGKDHLNREFPVKGNAADRVISGRPESFEILRAEGSPGAYRLVAVVTDARLDLNKRMTRGGGDWDAEPPQRPGTQGPPATAELADLLMKILNRQDMEGGDSGKWGYTVAKFNIVAQ